VGVAVVVELVAEAQSTEADVAEAGDEADTLRSNRKDRRRKIFST
jgi:hypothetical protein